MLNLKQMTAAYPKHLRAFKRNILREYLQYKILEAVYAWKQSNELVFMGGTAIHLLHGSARFSEDLDFDNTGMPRNALPTLADHVSGRLSHLGLSLETRISDTNAWCVDLRIRGILQQTGLSGHKEEKLFIHLYMAPQDYAYETEVPLINKFDVFTMVRAIPKEILLAQKFFAILNRSRPMGRDYYDTVFLMALTKPDWGYLGVKTGITTGKDLQQALLKHCAAINFKTLTRDVEPFLFSADDVQRVLLFKEYIAGYDFETT